MKKKSQTISLNADKLWSLYGQTDGAMAAAGPPGSRGAEFDMAAFEIMSWNISSQKVSRLY